MPPLMATIDSAASEVLFLAHPFVQPARPRASPAATASLSFMFLLRGQFSIAMALPHPFVMRGVMKSSSSLFVVLRPFCLNRYPSSGIWPSTGVLLTDMVSLFW